MCHSSRSVLSEKMITIMVCPQIFVMHVNQVMFEGLDCRKLMVCFLHGFNFLALTNSFQVELADL